MEAKLLTSEEVCQQLRMTAKNRIKMLCRKTLAGEIKGTKLGRVWRYKQEWVDAYIRRGESR